MKTHFLTTKKEYFELINKGIKKLEIRVGYFQIRKIKPGDEIRFKYVKENKFEVLRVSIYQSFEDMLSNEDYKLINPFLSKKELCTELKGRYPLDKEKLGVYVFELKKK